MRAWSGDFQQFVGLQRLPLIRCAFSIGSDNRRTDPDQHGNLSTSTLALSPILKYLFHGFFDKSAIVMASYRVKIGDERGFFSLNACQHSQSWAISAAIANQLHKKNLLIFTISILRHTRFTRNVKKMFDSIQLI